MRAAERALLVLRRAEAGASEVESTRIALRLDEVEVLLDLWRVDAAEAILEDVSRAPQAHPDAPGSCEEGPQENSIRALELQARASRVKGAYARAVEEWRTALVERRSQSPVNPEALAWTLLLAAEATWQAGDVDATERLFAEASDLADRALPSNSLAGPRAVAGIGLVVETRGEIERAEELYREALEKTRRARGEHHPLMANRWMALGNVALLREDLMGAQAAYEHAEEILGPLTDLCLASEKAALELNRGGLDARLGRIDSARQRLENARSIYTQTRGADHPHIAWVDEALADVLTDAGRLEEAGQALADARRLRDRGMPGSPIAVLTTARLAAQRAREGNSAEARALIRKVDLERAGLVSVGSGFEASLASRRAEAEELLGHLREAAHLRETVERLLARQLPASHPALAEARGQRARIAWLMNRRRQALHWALDAWQVQRKAVEETLRALPEGDALQYIERTRAFRDLLLCAAATSPDLEPAAVDEVTRALAASRALVAGAAYARQRIRLSAQLPDALTRGARDDETALHVAERRYATLLWQRIPHSSMEYAAALAAARRALEDAERRVSRSVSEGVRAANPPDGWQATSHPIDPWTRLEPGDALVAFGHYRCPVIAAGATEGKASSGYVAFVRLAGRAVETVRFPDGPALDQAIEKWYGAIASAAYAPPTEAQEDQVETLGNALLRVLWAPLAPRLEGVRRAFLVPDGELHYVSWYALPDGAQRYLIDAPRALHVLTAESDLSPRNESPTPVGHGRVVVLADPLMVSPSSDRPAVLARNEPDASRSACRFVDPAHLPRLDGAAAEAADLRAEAQLIGRSVEVATGVAATEEWLRAHTPGASIVHVAAHAGLLSPESCFEPRAAGGTALAELGALWQEATRARPLMRSGLFLSGSGEPTPLTAVGTESDGLLVATEAAQLDLRAAEWVVLSACSSRRGPVLDGEGMLGLHRAFQVAGARVVIASLWDVQDVLARQFMHALYVERLRKGAATIEALRSATRTVLNELRTRGQSTHPVQWAAFVASGDWR